MVKLLKLTKAPPNCIFKLIIFQKAIPDNFSISLNSTELFGYYFSVLAIGLKYLLRSQKQPASYQHPSILEA